MQLLTADTFMTVLRSPGKSAFNINYEVPHRNLCQTRDKIMSATFPGGGQIMGLHNPYYVNLASIVWSWWTSSNLNIVEVRIVDAEESVREKKGLNEFKVEQCSVMV